MLFFLNTDNRKKVAGATEVVLTFTLPEEGEFASTRLKELTEVSRQPHDSV
jgi:hypothetical protein